MSTNETGEPFRYGFRFGHGAGAGATPKTTRFVSRRIKLDIYCASEIVIAAALGLAIARYYVGGVLGVEGFLDQYLLPTLAIPVSMALVLNRSGLHKLSAITDFVGNMGRVTAAVAGTFVAFALAGIVFGVTDDYSRVWFGSWLSGTVLGVWFLRALAARTFSRWLRQGVMRKRVAVFGEWPRVEGFINRIGAKNQHLHIVGVFGNQPGPRGTFRTGTLDDMIDHGRKSGLDMVIIAPPYDDPALLDRVLDAVSMLSVEIKVLPPSGLSHLPLLGVSRQGRHQFIDIQHSRISDWSRMFKLVEDYVVAVSALAILSWLLLLIAAAIRLESKGPALFRQRRTGLNNEEFSIYKFRTMRLESEAGDFQQTERGDCRVTRVGRFLRRTSLDELPQLLNVLKGEMSIVGPRPHPIELNSVYAPQMHLFNKRHSVKPGITGWAQIHDHRGPIHTPRGMRKRLNYDLYYIDNWSIWFDIKIIAATPFMALIHRNAI